MSKGSFQCQRCRLSLVPHESLANLSSAKVSLLSNQRQLNKSSPASRLGPVGEADSEDGSSSREGTGEPGSDNKSGNGSDGVYRGGDKIGRIDKPNGGVGGPRHRKPPVHYGRPDESFVMLSESLMAGTITPNVQRDVRTDGDAHSISKRIDMLENLFEVLSAKSDIEYPLCSECAELVKDGLKAKYEEACSERDVYISFLNKLKDQPEEGSEEIEELEKEIAALENSNHQALQELKACEDEKDQAEQELRRLKQEEKELQQQEQEFFDTQNRMTMELAHHADEKKRVTSLNEYYRNQLHSLQKVNVYNDVFCIGHDGYFGTINGLRLGRLRDKKVEWSEINAAWGQTLLLLATVIHKLNFRLEGYRLRPLGSASRIEKIETDPRTGRQAKPVSMELYSSGDYSIERILNHRRLDTAMVAFLSVLKQVGEYVESLDPTLKLPYTIDHDKIGGCSIRLSMNASNESWTTACKYVLTNAKWILAYASMK